MKELLSYDDVILVPQYSTLGSREDARTSCTLGPLKLATPIISSNMDTITTAPMAVAMWEAGGVGALQRVANSGELVRHFLDVGDHDAECIVSIGVGEQSKDLLVRYYDFGARVVLVDVAHAHSDKMVEMLGWIKETYNDHFFIIAGNVATGDGAQFLEAAGADAIKVGIGGGCFVPGTLITLETGSQIPIENIQVGDRVITHTGQVNNVVDTLKFDRDEELIAINGCVSTTNHEYYVVDKDDAHLVADDNIHEYAKWIPAEMLTKNHMLIELD